MSDQTGDFIDVLLREQFDGPVPVDDFCDRVMDRLPGRRRNTNWPLAAGALAGVVMCWSSVRSAPITYYAWQDWLSGEPSASAIALFTAMLSMAVSALVWTIAEVGDGYDLAPRSGSERFRSLLGELR
jgi:hypothetical protein